MLLRAIVRAVVDADFRGVFDLYFLNVFSSSLESAVFSSSCSNFLVAKLIPDAVTKQSYV